MTIPSMMMSVRSLEVPSQSVRLLVGSKDDGNTNGNNPTAAVIKMNAHKALVKMKVVLLNPKRLDNTTNTGNSSVITGMRHNIG